MRDIESSIKHWSRNLEETSEKIAHIQRAYYMNNKLTHQEQFVLNSYVRDMRSFSTLLAQDIKALENCPTKPRWKTLFRK